MWKIYLRYVFYSYISYSDSVSHVGAVVLYEMSAGF